MNQIEETLIEQTELENGATLELYDASRTLIGDRMLVSLIARIKIPVHSLYQNPAGTDLPPADPLRSYLGDPIIWSHVKKRHFIDEREKSEVFESMLADFDVHMRAYVSHPEFPAKYVQKRLREHQKQSTWDK